MADFLQVKISAPDKDIFTGAVESVSSTNSRGKFDVLPGHANFISVIENQPIILRSKGKDPQTFTFSLAIISVNQNQVNIYTDVNLESN